MATIGQLAVSLGLDTTKFNKGVKDVDSSSGKMKSGLMTVGKVTAGLVGGLAALGGAFFAMANKVSGTTDRIDKLSQKIGLSREGFQEWEFIMSQSGASVEGLQMGFKTLVNQIDQAVAGTGAGAESFAKL